jgi:hypothetical protein
VHLHIGDICNTALGQLGYVELPIAACILDRLADLLLDELGKGGKVVESVF